MNKNLYFKICSFIIGGFLLIWSAGFTLFLVRERNTEKPTAPSEEKTVQSTVQSATLSHYTAQAEQDRVIIYEVYNNGYKKIFSVPNIDFRELTQQDRESFEKGIILKSKSDVASLIEDFTS